MQPTVRAKITAVGTYVPPRLLTNADLEKLVETSHDWIVTRTGISERHRVEPGMATSDMAVEAARECLAHRGLEPKDVEAILVATVTPDMLFPSTACLVQHKLGAPQCWGFDVLAACSGFLYALATGASLIAAGTHQRVLVIGADTMTSIIDYTDRATCVLFGDGAGAVLLEPAAPGEDAGLIDYHHQIEGMGGGSLYMPAGGSHRPASHETVDKREHFVHQEGQAVFKYAVLKMYEICRTVLERNGVTAADLDCFIPHQANLRIIQSTGERLGLDPKRVIVNIGKYGNTTAATIPLAMQDAQKQGLLHPGALALLAAVGAGYTCGAQLLRWAI
ncbi:MAG TPA: beta-ketoacyl-ACP synthase III [Terriglobales bacterium]|nr:beta-ketoacyl-ACP synthase III [Terriglobales bacterium]